ncbi:Glycosyl transferases group 1 [Pseudoxanthomonas sp. GM95]|uniref:glycosyltransferase n=1 Tax=Pseudoxanthomonas sp. GM95 TaxID=1881043 RepID=UPI0008D2ABDD|nr:glycosyltransferase [Pseudoxanthomonas sp. GM95]SEK60616.1 Glycosyl transferases group 1 [Pseudoxanthomonas sp. GM95]
MALLTPPVSASTSPLHAPGRVRLITRDNGVGLRRDLDIVARALRGNQIQSEALTFGGTRLVNNLVQAGTRLKAVASGRVDTQIFLERIYRGVLPAAHRNVLIPNPEWMLDKWLPLLPQFERVLCKTRNAERVFSALGCNTRYIGFTSEDRYTAGVPRQRAFLHVAGRSTAKGTDAVMQAWLRHPEWPTLTVVQSRDVPKVEAPNIDHRLGYLDDAQLRQLQNTHAFHLCPSEAEGFGHYLVEALSTGAVVITTDGEPMNELVTPERGILLQPAGERPMALGTRYRVDVAGIEDAVERALALPPETCASMGAAARQFFVDNDAGFPLRLSQALQPALDTGRRVPAPRRLARMAAALMPGSSVE